MLLAHADRSAEVEVGRGPLAAPGEFEGRRWSFTTPRPSAGGRDATSDSAEEGVRPRL